MVAENRASFINECQISTLGVSLSVHTSVIAASVCPAYQLDHHVACRRRDAFGCLLCLAVTDEHLYVVVATVVDPRYPGTVGRAKACMCQTVAVGGMHHCCCRRSWRGSRGQGADGTTNETSARLRRTAGLIIRT